MKQIILLLMLVFCAKIDAQIVTHVTLTYYQPVKKQCNSDPKHTADGSEVNLKKLKSGTHKWVAISRDLIYLFKKRGDENIFADPKHPKKIWIEGFGIYEVHDLMNSRLKHAVDIMIHPADSKRIKLEKVKIKILQ